MEIGHTGTGHTEPVMSFSNGTGRLYDLNVSAALLSLSGAAWDGTNAPVYEPAQDDSTRSDWLRRLDEPGTRQIVVQLVGHSLGIVDELITRKDGWTDGKTGQHYPAGSKAPIRRVCYHLTGEYRYRTNGAVTRRVPWVEDDFRFWFRQWVRRGGLLSAARGQIDRRNELLDLNRAEYGIGSNLRMGV